jgi:hypothetical protein
MIMIPVEIVSASLLAGGIGIRNIMLVSVTEGTREIRIYYALGVQRHYISLQFLVKAPTLSLLGVLVRLGHWLSFCASKMTPNFPDAKLNGGQSSWRPVFRARLGSFSASCPRPEELICIRLMLSVTSNASIHLNRPPRFAFMRPPPLKDPLVRGSSLSI